MWDFARRPRWILSHILVLLLIIAMINLGFWQLRRLDEKKTLNSHIRFTWRAAHRADHRVGTGRLDAVVDQRRAMAPRSATGTYRVADELVVSNRSIDGDPGFWVLTPLVQSDGSDHSGRTRLRVPTRVRPTRHRERARARRTGDDRRRVAGEPQQWSVRARAIADGPRRPRSRRSIPRASPIDGAPTCCPCGYASTAAPARRPSTAPFTRCPRRRCPKGRISATRSSGSSSRRSRSAAIRSCCDGKRTVEIARPTSGHPTSRLRPRSRATPKKRLVTMGLRRAPLCERR